MKSFFRILFSVRTIVLLLLGAAIVAGGGYLWWISANGSSGSGFRMEPVVRKNLSATITATGTLEPEEVIDVGAQVAGLILNFGPADPTKSNGPDYSVAGPGAAGVLGSPLGQGPLLAAVTLLAGTGNGPVVDYCTPVKKGQVLAWIDPTIYQTHMDQSKAALATAQAVVASAQANLTKSQANRNNLKAIALADESSPGAVPAETRRTDEAAFLAADADTKVQEAAVAQAQAGVQQATANLKEAQTNLNYCTISAPVDGVIVDRRVNIGQTVVASLSAPSLFLIAKDLTRMQVWASVNEADIGNIHVGQDVTFSVDARPGKVFTGRVLQIRLNAAMTQNVVTYTVVVETSNKMIDVPTQVHVKTPSGETVNTTPTQELELLPYLTANLTFHIASRQNALLVPNAALRWRPQPAQVAPQYRDEYVASLQKKAMKDSSSDDATDTSKPAPDSGDKKPAKPQGGPSSRGMVWVQEGTFVRPIKIVTGLTDGAMTEVVSVHEGDTLDEGTMLISGENTGKAAAGTTNPFAPKLPFGPQPKKPDDQPK